MRTRLTLAFAVLTSLSMAAPLATLANPAVQSSAQMAPLSPAIQIAQPAHAPRSAAWWTDAGRILSGETPNAGSALGKLANQPSVQNHRELFRRSWTQFEAVRLKPTMKFAQEEIATQPPSAGPVYYPFSGPDAMYVLSMFPNATQFALAGLEPVGELPDLGALSEADLGASLTELRRSLRSLTQYSFFRTNDMRAEFSKNQFSGVTPILLLFIARHGFAVQNVEQVVMESDASLRVAAGGLKNVPADRVPGVRITFLKPGDARPRTLYYFTADLSDGGLANVPQPLKWAANFAPKATYIKSASYLMHTGHFSKVRGFIIAKTELIVQDDSGIPMKFFADTSWDRTLFGSYDGPIRLFANRYQQDLYDAYAAAAKPLNFGIGYDHQARASNIQRFVRKRGLTLDNRIAGAGMPAR